MVQQRARAARRIKHRPDGAVRLERFKLLPDVLFVYDGHCELFCQPVGGIVFSVALAVLFGYEPHVQRAHYVASLVVPVVALDVRRQGLYFPAAPLAYPAHEAARDRIVLVAPHRLGDQPRGEDEQRVPDEYLVGVGVGRVAAGLQLLEPQPLLRLRVAVIPDPIVQIQEALQVGLEHRPQLHRHGPGGFSLQQCDELALLRRAKLRPVETVLQFSVVCRCRQRPRPRPPFFEVGDYAYPVGRLPRVPAYKVQEPRVALRPFCLDVSFKLVERRAPVVAAFWAVGAVLQALQPLDLYDRALVVYVQVTAAYFLGRRS